MYSCTLVNDVEPVVLPIITPLPLRTQFDGKNGLCGEYVLYRLPF